MREEISAPGAVAVGPYSHAVGVGDLVICSGQTPLDPATGELVTGGIAAQTAQCFANLFAVLDGAGLGSADVVKTNVYLTDMATFAEMNATYETMFAEPYPARTTIGVASLPLGASVEIELIANRANRRSQAIASAATSTRAATMLDAATVRSKHLEFRSGLRGYHQEEVLAYLGRIALAVQILGEDAGTEATPPLPDDFQPAAIRSQEFRVVWRGFERTDVRAYLQELATGLQNQLDGLS